MDQESIAPIAQMFIDARISPELSTLCGTPARLRYGNSMDFTRDSINFTLGGLICIDNKITFSNIL